MKKLILLAIITLLVSSHVYPQAAIHFGVANGDIAFITPEGESNYGFGGGYDSGGSQGLWYEAGSSYIRPLADGSGWEAGILDPNDYNGIQNSGGGYTGPLKMKWTPSTGWEVTAGPSGTEMYYYSHPDWGAAPINDFTISDANGNVVFDSATWVPGTIPSAEDLAWWDNTLQNFYENNPQLPNPYAQSSVFVEQAQKLNVGLSFENGAWVPLQ
jgi:hypothetical protein